MSEPPPTPGRVLIVTGPSGAGKTTAARALAEAAGPPGGVHLHGDDFFTYIRSGLIGPWLAESHHQNRTIAEVLSAAAFTYAAGGYFTVLDWVVGPWFVDIYRAAARRTGLRLDYVLLRPTEAQASQRAHDRADAPIADYTPMRGLFRQLSDVGALEPHVLDTSGLSLEQTLARIREGLTDDRYRLE